MNLAVEEKLRKELTDVAINNDIKHLVNYIYGQIEEEGPDSKALEQGILDESKSFNECFQYVTMRAYAWCKEQMKATVSKHIIKFGNSGVGVIPPDETVFGWAIDYYVSPGAKEELEKAIKPPVAAHVPPKPKQVSLFEGNGAKAVAKAKAEKPPMSVYVPPKPQPKEPEKQLSLDALMGGVL